MKEAAVLKIFATRTLLSGTKLDFQVELYISKEKNEGIYSLNLKKTWEKLLLVACTIVTIENLVAASVIYSSNSGQ